MRGSWRRDGTISGQRQARAYQATEHLPDSSRRYPTSEYLYRWVLHSSRYGTWTICTCRVWICGDWPESEFTVETARGSVSVEPMQVAFRDATPESSQLWGSHPLHPWHILGKPSSTPLAHVCRTHTPKTFWIWNMLGVGFLTRK